MKIAMLSDNILTPTGYANVTLELLNRLKGKGHEVYNLAHNYHGQKLTKFTFEDGKEYEINIIGGGNAGYFQDRLAEVINKYKFDVLIVLLDTFMMKGSPYGTSWFEHFDFTPCKTIFYFPSDGRKFPMGCESILRKVDLPIAMAKYGQEQILREHKIKTHYIPHGVDLKNYYREDKEKAKEFFNLKNKFVFGTVARNQGRKMLDRTIKGFARFLEIAKNRGIDINDIVLLMHTDPNDAAQVNDLAQLIREYNITNNVKFSGMKAFDGFPLEKMRTLYNCFDVFVLSTSGEGFGIPTIEAQACGIPVVITDYTTSEELTDKGQTGLLVPIITEITGTYNVERGVIDIHLFAECMLNLFLDEEKRFIMGQLAEEKVRRDYDWEKLTEEWERTLQELIQ